MKRVLLVTGHYLESKRQAGFHWLADAYWRAGWEVVFFTAPISWLSWLRRDYRFNYPIRKEANRLRWVQDRLGSFVWFTPWHPCNLRSELANNLTKDLFSSYGEMPLGCGESLVASADMIIFESTPAQLLFEQFKRINGRARYVYRVSDDLNLLRCHPSVMESEKRNSSKYDLLSVPSRFIFERFKHLPNARLHYHGVPEHLFAGADTNPYRGDWDINAVFVGNVDFDADFLDRASRMFPNWGFHIIGEVGRLPNRPNVLAYGEMPYDQTVSYIKYADIGLHTLAYTLRAQSFSDTLKVVQYTHCRLPIVLPEFIPSQRTNAFSYSPADDESIRKALLAARDFDPQTLEPNGIISSDDLAGELAGALADKNFARELPQVALA